VRAFFSYWFACFLLPLFSFLFFLFFFFLLLFFYFITIICLFVSRLGMITLQINKLLF